MQSNYLDLPVPVSQDLSYSKPNQPLLSSHRLYINIKQRKHVPWLIAESSYINPNWRRDLQQFCNSLTLSRCLTVPPICLILFLGNGLRVRSQSRNAVIRHYSI
jgi:hypothetical protein